ncbi:MAG: hypothetical protein JNK56_11590, partial [Myxococcales bacterium]|nr:hypothetical protein [Myxococcales bacterium]
MARQGVVSVSVQVSPGQPRLAWQASEASEAGPARACVVRERVGAGPPAGRLIAAEDNLEALRSLVAEGLAGQVDLVYIDPPFMAGSDRSV